MLYSTYSRFMHLPDWYLHLLPEIKNYIFDFHERTFAQKNDEYKNTREALIDFVRKHLPAIKRDFDPQKEQIFDKERKAIDTVVIHHTSRSADTPIDVIETLHLLNLYVRDFSDVKNAHYGQKIFSGHEYMGSQTFLAYHYIIFPDGDCINPLKDEYIGWHCGNWDYNCRSIAVCFHDDLESKNPSKKAINTARRIIKLYSPTYILGHREIKPSTSCPGNSFLGIDGWKNLLIT